jgi:hypothetical protein
MMPGVLVAAYYRAVQPFAEGCLDGRLRAEFAYEVPMTTLKQVDDFLALKRVAVVGVSHNPRETSYVLWQELRQRRYEAVPVNPGVKELDGQTCYAKVQEIQPPVEGVLIMTSAKTTDQIVHDCAEAGVKHVWMYGGMGPGAKTKTAIAFCEEKGIDVVAGLCPYMFLPGTPAFHAPHRFWKKLTRSYPQ